MNDATRIEEFVPVSRPQLWGNEKAYVLEAVESGWISSRGEFIERFETAFASFIGAKHAVAVCNGTCALQLAISALGIGVGDEVIVPDFTMMAPVFAVMHSGARPVPVDADSTWNMDVERVEAAITADTKAILAVHTYGHPVNMKELLDIAERHGISVIEDAAEAHGATAYGRSVGTIGAIGTFSFYANKIVTTGEGGMVVTNDDGIAETLKAMRNMNFGGTIESRFEHKGLGFNFRMSNLHAAVGAAQMTRVQEAVAERERIADEYRRELQSVVGLTLPPMSDWANPVNWVFGIVVESEFGTSRPALQEWLRDEGVETRRFFTPLHAQPFYDGSTAGAFPVATLLGQHGLYLPTFVGLESDTIRRIATLIRSAQQQDNG